MNLDTFHAVLASFLQEMGTTLEDAERDSYWLFSVSDDEVGLSISGPDPDQPSVGRFFTVVAELDPDSEDPDLFERLLDLNNELTFTKVYVPEGSDTIGICCDFPLSDDLTQEVLEAWSQLLVQSLYQVRETLFPEEETDLPEDLPPGAV